MAPKLGKNDMEDFVNVWTDADGQRSANTKTDFYGQWVEHSSAQHAIPPIIGADALRKLYPNHSLVMTNGYGFNILGFPAASVTPLENNPVLTNLFFVPLPRNKGIPGVLTDQVEFGAFKVAWSQFEFIIHAVHYPQGLGTMNQFFILHEGPEEVSRLFLLAAGAWADGLHDEIWVFNQGFWSKDHSLWQEVQKADWKDVILNEEFKKALQKDVYGFFASEAIYKELAVPWKRGLIMYGPPGNGKTISLKTIMKTCGEKGFAPLYVKSFKIPFAGYKGEEGAMADVFDKARQYSPCVIILEDLDSLINDGNRSFFLNQMDGLEGNDGLLVIGTTNHFDRLDPGLSTRPSRFDRKYNFDDPIEEERKLYAQYWQQKLKPNKEIDFPDRLVNKVARQTDGFSFAYLKEAFVSSLVTLAGIEGNKPSFESELIKQIEALRKQLDKQSYNTMPSYDFNTTALHSDMSYSSSTKHHRSAPSRPRRPDASKEYDVHEMLEALSQVGPRADPSRTRFHQAAGDSASQAAIGHDARDFRDLLDTLSDSPPLNPASQRTYTTAPPGKRINHDRPQASQDNERERIRDLMDNISAGSDLPGRFYSRPSTDLAPPVSQPDWSTTNPFARSDNYKSSSSGTSGNSFSNTLMWK